MPFRIPAFAANTSKEIPQEHPVVTPFEKFRAQYPEGGLTADLISIHDGQYVVRAAVTSQGKTLATGLATSVDVQIAEDRARDRALAVLGITSDSAAVSASAPVPAASAPVPSAPAPSADTKSLSIADAPPDPDEPDVTEAPAEAIEAPAEDDMGPPIDAIAEEPADSKPSAAVIALENFNTSAIPVDLSDVIAQTDVELTRLGWTNAQGREYLETTYGKRSRQQLTDEELLSFLLYLEEL